MSSGKQAFGPVGDIAQIARPIAQVRPPMLAQAVTTCEIKAFAMGVELFQVPYELDAFIECKVTVEHACEQGANARPSRVYNLPRISMVFLIRTSEILRLVEFQSASVG